MADYVTLIRAPVSAIQVELAAYPRRLQLPYRHNSLNPQLISICAGLRRTCACRAMATQEQFDGSANVAVKRGLWMKRESSGQILSAVFVDYDNIYLSLKRRNEEAAKRFAKDSNVWLAEIESGRLITPTNKLPANVQRRIVLNRCYGNPVPRRNQNDNSTDMNSFPFVRHHFLRAGFEVVDCPPLTAQLKNSSDIRMVMDVRDYLHHETYFDEFIILSGDADFTPVLHRLRAHARRTVVFANDFTAAPYVAIADGEVRESDLISVLFGEGSAGQDQPQTASAADTRREIIAEVTGAVRNAGSPLPLEVLAERATRALGHDRTVGTDWAGAGSFRELLLQSLPEGFRLSEQPPYVVYDATRRPAIETRPERTDRPSGIAGSRSGQPSPAIGTAAALTHALDSTTATSRAGSMQPQSAQQVYRAAAGLPLGPARESTVEISQAPAQRMASQAPAASAPPKSAEGATALQQSIARIHEACKAPPLSPPEYRALFELLAQEIKESGLQGAQTIANVADRARELGLDIRRDDVRFALDVVSEADPWFEQGASANLFAGRFRNFVVARCRSHGLNLTPDEIDLIDAWFTGAGSSPVSTRPTASNQSSLLRAPAPLNQSERWWGAESSQEGIGQQGGSRHPAPALTDAQPSTQGLYSQSADEFPRIVRTRLRS